MVRHMLTGLVLFILLLQAFATPSMAAKPPAPPWFSWTTVVNSNDWIPPDFDRKFNSYNQPSVNASGMVVFRARSRGGGDGGPATHGIYLRDLSDPVGAIIRVLDRTVEVPYPNNLTTVFSETPSFPRIDTDSETIVTRGNHPPVWRYLLPDQSETRGGTSGIYAEFDGRLLTGAAQLGVLGEFGFFAVPGLEQITPFDVFPGAPAVTDGATIVFKGNYTADDGMKTGVYFRDLSPVKAGGEGAVCLIADSYTTIPGTRQKFGSTAPPSAAGRWAVFTGLDNEEAPSLGGIYLVELDPELGPNAERPLRPLVTIGSRVPGGSPRDTFTQLSEGLSFDGRYVGFWGAWGEDTRKVRLFCPEEGDKDRIDYCINRDPATICDSQGCYQDKAVPVNQGIFIHDVQTGRTSMAAKIQPSFDDFLFWNYSGRAVASGGDHRGGGMGCSGQGNDGGGDCDGQAEAGIAAVDPPEENAGAHDGEPVRWRASSFIAVSGRGEQTSYVVFKARKKKVTGLYLSLGPGQTALTLVDTTTDGRRLDPEAPEGSVVTEVGLEREGLRNGWLVINARMEVGGEGHEDGMAGIYFTRVPSAR